MSIENLSAHAHKHGDVNSPFGGDASDRVQVRTCLSKLKIQIHLQRARQTGITYLDSVKSQYSGGSKFLIIPCAFRKGAFHKLWRPGFALAKGRVGGLTCYHNSSSKVLVYYPFLEVSRSLCALTASTLRRCT